MPTEPKPASPLDQVPVSATLYTLDFLSWDLKRLASALGSDRPDRVRAIDRTQSALDELKRALSDLESSWNASARS